MRKVMYIAINKELNLSKGKIAAHTAASTFDYLHKLYKTMDNNKCTWVEFVNEFKQNGDTIVVVKASEKELLKWENQGYVTVRDTGKNELPADTITTVNLGVYDKDKGIPNWIQRLRLL